MHSIFPNLLLFFISFQGANCTMSPLFRFCFNHENYTDSSPYATNLNQLFDLLHTKVPLNGFPLDSIGQGMDKVNGLALCRGDVNATNCMSCVNDATKKLQERCPRRREQYIVWYDYCLLKYSNEYFFGESDEKNKFYMVNIYDVDDPATFNAKVNELLSGLSYNASQTPMLYAVGELQLEKTKTLYGLAQCTRDLFGPSCKKCLDDAISQLPDCCDGKEGGRVVGGSCYVRYELYPIVEA